MASDEGTGAEGEQRDDWPDASLEYRLSQRPTTDTDVIEFLVIAGLERSWDRLRGKAQYDEVSDRIAHRYYGRRQRLSRKAKTLETKVARRLGELYFEGHVRTVGDVVAGLRRGEVSRRLFWEPAFALNDILRYYEFTPIDEQALYRHFERRNRSPPEYRYLPPF